MTTAELHPGLAGVGRALDRVAPILPTEVERARRSLAHALTPIAQSVWPEIAHRLSLLTNTGLPVEFSWTSRQVAVRWTAEIAGPETPKDQRLAIAGELASIDVEWLEALQVGHRLRYGAWLGGRHRGGTDQFKVYGELPAGAPPPPPADHPSLRALEWWLLGIAADGTHELYGRGDIDADALDGFERAAFGTNGTLRSAVAELLGTTAMSPKGFLSTSVHPAAGIVELTWFSFARVMFAGHDEAVDALSRWSSGDTGKELLEALAAGADDGRWRVGMVGVGLDADGSTWVQTAIRPS
jgi:hypothetical protein